MVGIGERAADIDIFEAGQQHDLARRRFLNFHALEPFVAVQLGHAPALNGLVALERQQRDGIAKVHHTTLHATDRHAAEVRRILDGGHEHLELPFGVGRRRRYGVDDRLIQGLQIDRRDIHVHRGEPLLRAGVHHRRVQLLFRGFEFDEQRQYFIMHPQRIGAGAVDLVDDDDRGASEFERLAEHEPRLRHRSVEGVHDEQHTFDHAQNALHFATEIGVARRVDDVDLRVVPADRRIFGENGDSALFFKRIGIHHAFFYDLIFAESSSLAEHLVDEGGLPVVDVRDDSDVANLHSLKS